MQENNTTLTVIGVVTLINMLTIGVLGFPIGFFTGSSRQIAKINLFVFLSVYI
jgi:hypothetical protein